MCVVGFESDEKDLSKVGLSGRSECDVVEGGRSQGVR